MQTKDTTFTHYLLAILISATLVGFSYQNRLNWLKLSLTTITSPLRIPASNSRLYLQNKLSLLKQLPNKQQAIDQLKNQNAQLQNQLLTLQDLKDQNQQLKQLLDVPAAAQAPIQPARITGLSRYAYIDHGSTSHIKPGYAVISGSSLLGIINQVNPRTSSVRLLTDPQIQISAKTNKGQTGQVIFQKQTLRFTQVSPDPTLTVDQPVYTQGTDNYPSGLLIGTIRQVQPAQTNVYQSASLTPAINPKSQLTVATILYHLQP